MSASPDAQPNGHPEAALESRLQQLRDAFPETLLDIKMTDQEMAFTVAPEALADFVDALRQRILPPQHSFCDACGVEREDSYEAIYRLSLLREPKRITIRTHMPKVKPVLPTLSHLYKGALWAERELAEMFGVRIEGHPDLRHLLLPEDWQGYPLRKDYECPLDHPYLAPDPLRDDPAKVLGPVAETEAEALDLYERLPAARPMTAPSASRLEAARTGELELHRRAPNDT